MANFNMTFGSDQHFNFGFSGNQNFGVGMDNSANPDLGVLRNAVANDGIGYILTQNPTIFADGTIENIDEYWWYDDGSDATCFFLHIPGGLVLGETYRLTAGDTVFSAEAELVEDQRHVAIFEYDPDIGFYFGILEDYDDWYYVAIKGEFDGDTNIKVEGLYASDVPHKISNTLIEQDPIIKNAIENYGIGYFDSDEVPHYIDEVFLQGYIGKYKTINPDTNVSHFAYCTTSESTQTKVTSGSSSFNNTEGFYQRICFTKGNTYAGTLYLNVNSKGSKAAYIGADYLNNFQFPANTILDFVYYSDGWRLVGGIEATTSRKGIVKLSTSTSSTSTNLAATPSAVKSAYDLADSAIPKANISTSVSSASTNSQVPSSKLFYDTVGDVESILEALL